VEHIVRIAHHAVVAEDGELVSVGLGSCIAIAIHDPMARVAGLAHILLPAPPANRAVENRAKFASTAVPLLLEEMRALGAKGPYVGKIVGGAKLFGDLLASTGGTMGARNADAARVALAAARVRIAGEEVGGDFGRTIRFDVATGAVAVRSVRGGEHVL
jgi:chemotaxis protein CheD